MKESRGLIGFACAYTPLPLIHAAGFTPYRVLPEGQSPDQAGHLLHDNLCPHVKRILDRALGGDLPELAGMVFMNSCDAMRRLHDAWSSSQRDIKTALIDLPSAVDESTVRFFRNEMERLARTLEGWGGEKTADADIRRSMALYDRLYGLFGTFRRRIKEGTIDGGYPALQEAYNRASASPPEESIAALEGTLKGGGPAGSPNGAVGIYLFGNVLPDPEAFRLFESCGARILSDDICTGSRLFNPMNPGDGEDALLDLARGLLTRPKCARTFNAQSPGDLAGEILRGAKASGARGVIGYTAKFCDPYIARVPGIRDALRGAGIPFLLLEGDCTLRSIGQQRTRIEAFIEMVR